MRIPTTYRGAAGQRGVTITELLAVMVIGTIVSTMLLITWFALNDSYSYSIYSSQTRDSARQALNRMTREIRDAETMPISAGTTEPAVVRARTWWIMFSTTFNESGNTSYASQPHFVAFRLYRNPTTRRYELWRFEDRTTYAVGATVNPSTAIANFNTSPATDDPTGYSYNETVNGEGAQLMVRNVVNYGSSPVPQTPLFQYNLIESDGSQATQQYVYYAENRIRIMAVQVRLLADMNPEKAPVYVDLKSTAQLRNQRSF